MKYGLNEPKTWISLLLRHTQLSRIILSQVRLFSRSKLIENSSGINIPCKSYKRRQIIIAPTGVGKTTLFVFEGLYKTMVSKDSHFTVFLSSSTDLVPETVSRLKKVLISYIFDEMQDQHFLLDHFFA